MNSTKRQLVSPRELQGQLERGECVLVDVREGVEWSQGHVDGCRHVPLGELGERCGELPEDGRVVLMCASGKRSAKAADLLREQGHANVVELEGGMQSWESAGLEVVRPESAPWPLERQVRLAAGLLVVAGLAVGLVWPPAVFLSWFVGAGLVFAALTDWCGMGLLLAKAPWNRPKSSKRGPQADTCSVSSGGG